jgi:hypothetical protein
MNLGMGFQDNDWIYLAQGRVQWTVLGNIQMNLEVPLKPGIIV